MYTTKSHYRIMPKVIGSLMEDVLHNGYQKVFGDQNWNEGTSAPVNIRETDAVYEINVMAPGLKKDKFMLNVDKNVLHISYDDQVEVKEDETEEKWLRKEYKVKTFMRSFTLNDKVNVMDISAKYSDGILVVTLPKKESTQAAAKEITVD